jgi:hypothetical protein
MAQTTGAASGAPDDPRPDPSPRILFVPGPAADGPAGRELRVRIIDGDQPVEGDPPMLDADGLLRFRGRWVPIPDTQIPVVDLLVRNLGRLVRNSDVRAAYEQAGGSGTATSLRSVVHRLGRRVAEVGLRLHVVRSRGLVLEIGGA